MLNLKATNTNHSWRAYIYTLPFMLILISISVLVFGPAGDDDGHITYTAAKNLADFGQITNNNGEWVEQGSSLLHVLSLGFFYKIIHAINSHISIINLGPIFSLGMAVICIPLVFQLAKQCGVNKPLHAALLTSLSTAFSYWAMGGLESTLVTCCFLLFASIFSYWYTTKTYQIIPFLTLIIILCLTLTVRPEAFFVLLLFTLFFAAGRFSTLNKQFFIFILTTCILFIALCALRFFYYGQYFPQPVYAKAEGISLLKIAIGFYYFIYSKQLSIVIFSALTLSLIKHYKLLSTHLFTLLCLTLSYLAFIINAGGDWMAGGRFFVPIIPLLIILSLYQLQKSVHYQRYLYALVFLSGIEIIGFQVKLSAGIPVWQESFFHQRYTTIAWNQYHWTESNNLVHARDIPVTDALFAIIDHLNPSQKITIASIQMGMIPYHLHNRYHNHIEIIDMRGLTTQHISHCPALASFPKTWSGIAISYRDYFAAQKSCHLPQPDIIYDLLNREDHINQDRLLSLQEQGYTIIYRQQGVLAPKNHLKSVDVDTFIAVSADVLQQLPLALKDQKLHIGAIEIQQQ